MIESKAGCPTEIAGYGLAYAGQGTELIAGHEVVTRLGILGKSCGEYEIGVEFGGVAVVAVESEFGCVKVGYVKEKLAVRNESLEISVCAQYAGAFCVGRCLNVDLIVILGVVGAVAVVENVTAQSVLKTQVRVKTYYRKRSEIPS